MTDPTPDRMAEIVAEVERQSAKWPPAGVPPLQWIAVLTNEIGEAAEGVLRPGRNGHTYADELVQVAAVAIRALEAHDLEATRS
jgi:hypothetical protein